MRAHSERCEQWQPYPELVEEDPRPWQVVDTAAEPGMSPGFVLPGKRIVGVPFTPDGRMVGRHEMGHVLWSPRRVPRRLARSGLAQAVEDARINLGLAHIGLPLVLEDASRERVLELARSDLERGALGHFAMRCLASIGTSLESELRALAAAGSPVHWRVSELTGLARARLERARREGEDVASFRSGSAVARWLRRELGHVGISDISPVGMGCCTAHGREGGRGSRLAEALRARAVVLPGRMRVTTAPLCEPCVPEAPGRRRWRSAEEGTELRHFHRFAVDQRVFRLRRSREPGGGSVLVDVSGSMSLGAADIERIIAAAPGATLVALYSGSKGEGELRIVVQNGRRAGPEHLSPPGRGNIVDVPALAWLARQRPPRIWISDGGVTGVDDQPSRGLLRECRRICASARIERVPDAAGAAALLAGARAPAARAAPRSWPARR